MGNQGKNSDLELVQQCIERRNEAWVNFLHRFRGLIHGRISQIFFRYNFRGGTADFQDAFDAVVDHLLYGKGLNGFKRDDSLDGYVRTVTTRAVIDWYRQRSSAKNLHSAGDVEIVAITSESASNLTPADHIDNSEQSSATIYESSLSPQEHLLLKALICRTVDIDDADIDAIARLAERSVIETEGLIRQIRQSLDDKWAVNQQKYESLQIVWVQMTMLERRGDLIKFERRKSQYDKLLAEYRKRGIEPYPTRREIAELFNWDINKVDRLFRKLEGTLAAKNVVKFEDKEKSA